MIPLLVAKLKEFERRKAAKALIARRLLTFVWRRRIRKLKELKRKEQEQARRDAAMSSKLKKAAGKKDKGKKAAGGGGGSTRHLLPHEIMEVIPSPRDAAKGGRTPRGGAPPSHRAAVKLSKQRAGEGGGGAGGDGAAVGVWSSANPQKANWCSRTSEAAGPAATTCKSRRCHPSRCRRPLRRSITRM